MRNTYCTFCPCERHGLFRVGEKEEKKRPIQYKVRIQLMIAGYYGYKTKDAASIIIHL